MNNEIEKLRYIFPRGSQSFFDANTSVRTEADKPASRKALGGKVGRKEKGDARIGLSYVLYRVRLLDPDAVHGATKVCTDVLQQIGIIPGDGPNDITLEVTQEKVAHFKDEKTVLNITYP